jgi:GT2 family glycosyltransferase
VYGRLDMLMNLLATLGPTLPPNAPIEILAVDDASPGLDLRQVKALSGAQIIRRDVNGGFPAACNTGALAAHGEVLFFLNSDTEAIPGWYEPLLNVFVDHNDVAVVGVKTVFPVLWWCRECRGYVSCKKCPNGHDAVQAVRIQSAGGWFDARNGPYHRYFGWDANDPLVNVQEAVSWVTGAAMAVRSSVFREMQGFDENYTGGYFEDVDLCMRVRQSGWRVMYEPKSVFVHVTGASFVPVGDKSRFYINSKRFHVLWDKTIVPDNRACIMVDY